MEMKTYTERLGFACSRSYGILRPAEVIELDKTLTSNDILISHVSDGEYPHNIFGNVFSNYSNALVCYRTYLNDNKAWQHNDEYIITIIQEYWKGKPMDYYIGKIHSGFRDANVWPHLEGRLTVETINDKFRGDF